MTKSASTFEMSREPYLAKFARRRDWLDSTCSDTRLYSTNDLADDCKNLSAAHFKHTGHL